MAGSKFVLGCIEIKACVDVALTQGGTFAYSYSCHICLLEFFIVFKLKNNKKFRWPNATVIGACCK